MKDLKCSYIKKYKALINSINIYICIYLGSIEVLMHIRDVVSHLREDVRQSSHVFFGTRSAHVGTRLEGVEVGNEDESPGNGAVFVRLEEIN